MGGGGGRERAYTQSRGCTSPTGKKSSNLKKYPGFLPQKHDVTLSLLPELKEKMLDLSCCKAAEHFSVSSLLRGL